MFDDLNFLEIDYVSMHTDGWVLTYKEKERDPQFPTPHIHLNMNMEPVIQNALIVARALEKHFTLIRRHNVGSVQFSAKQLEVFEFAQETIGRFATEAARLAQSTTQNYDEFARLLREKTTELDQRYGAKETELETRYQEKLRDIETREGAHGESVKQFELRNNTAVRRDLLREIKSKIETQSAMQLSKPTSRKRRILHAVCLGTLLLSATFVGWFAYKIGSVTAFDWCYLIPLSTGSLIFVSTGIFYIRWNDQWFRDHARAEMETRKLSADILRASWLAELFFEWEQKKDTAMPPELVSSFTRGLFEFAALEGKLHPADQLHELLKEFSTLKLDKDGFEVSKKK